MSQLLLLVVPKRKLLTDVQVNRLSIIFLELGKFTFAGFVIGYFVPQAGVSKFQFWMGLLGACASFIASVLLARKEVNGH